MLSGQVGIGPQIMTFSDICIKDFVVYQQYFEPNIFLKKQNTEIFFTPFYLKNFNIRGNLHFQENVI
jgi:hypothetical protein